MGYAIATLIGVSKAYQNLHNESIFTGILIPEGMDRDLLIDRIYHRCGEFSVAHTDWEYMHYEILNFFACHLQTFTRMWDVLQIEYNPLENYDRNEEWHDNGENKMHDDGTDTTTLGSSSTRTNAAENSNTYEPYDKTTQSGSDSVRRTNDNNGKFENHHFGRVRGNIGVTTSQQMLRSEFEDVAPLNVYETIADYFADEFCIQCY